MDGDLGMGRTPRTPCIYWDWKRWMTNIHSYTFNWICFWCLGKYDRSCGWINQNAHSRSIPLNFPNIYLSTIDREIEKINTDSIFCVTNKIVNNFFISYYSFERYFVCFTLNDFICVWMFLFFWRLICEIVH